MTDELSRANDSCSVPATSAMNPSSSASSGYRCSIKLQGPQQLVVFSLKFSYIALTSCSLLMLCLIGRRKISHKSFRWTDFGGIYTDIPPVATHLTQRRRQENGGGQAALSLPIPPLPFSSPPFPCPPFPSHSP